MRSRTPHEAGLVSLQRFMYLGVGGECTSEWVCRSRAAGDHTNKLCGTRKRSCFEQHHEQQKIHTSTALLKS
jgi:hypothetical protein